MKTMRKLRLDPNALKVEAFPSVDAPDLLKGTVQAHESSLGGDCPSESWSGPVNCLCCGSNNYDSECCHTDPIDC